MGYLTGCHTTFHHRYHLVSAPQYRFKVLDGEVRLRVREIIRQVCAEMGMRIINGALLRDHVHMFVEIPPHVSVSDFVHRAKKLLLNRVRAGTPLRNLPHSASLNLCINTTL